MNASEYLPSDLVAELGLLKDLPQDQEGPIADTYERLQSISFLRAASLPDEISDPDTRVYVALLQARELAFFNIASLFRDVSADILKTAQLDLASNHLRWIYDITRLACDITNAAATLGQSTDEVNGQTDGGGAGAELNAAIREFNDVSMTYLSSHEHAADQSIEGRYLLDGASVFIHTTKNIFQLLEAIFDLPLAPVGGENLNSHILRAAVHAINTKSPTYMMQFRLLHQIPEILSFEAARLLESAAGRVSKKAFGDAAADLSLANVCLNQVVSSLHPLVELMYPSEYYKFRAHLGQTSGSHSNDLAKTVLRQAYLSLAERYVDLKLPSKPKRGSFERILSDEMIAVHRNISMWRAVHIMLPRSILGSQATSLIGSRNAEQIVREMKNSFEARDSVLKEQQRKQPADAGNRPNETQAAIGHALRIMTGAVTRRRFPDVETRAGTFSPKR